jgi:hypothetical protein
VIFLFGSVVVNRRGLGREHCVRHIISPNRTITRRNQSLAVSGTGAQNTR